MLSLKNYGCEAIEGMIQDGSPTEMLREKLSLKLEANHATVFQYLIWAEESQMSIDICYYDMQEAVMKAVPGGYLALRVSLTLIQ